MTRIGDTITVRVHAVKEDGTDLDISSASTMQIVLNDEDAAVLKYDMLTTPAVEFDDEIGAGTGADGRVMVKLPSTALTVDSIYRVQAKFTWSGGDSFRTEIGRFKVRENLKEA